MTDAVPSRWWLSRGPVGLTYLHIEELGPRQRGYRVTVTAGVTRFEMRHMLAHMRTMLAETLERQDRPVKTFDVVETDEQPRG